MFATLVIQFPSEFKGGKFIVTHNGETKTYAQDEHKGFHYIAHYADCEHEIEPIESGYRLALVYSLCYTATDPLPTADAAQYNALASAIRRLPPRATHILCTPLEHEYTHASLSSRGGAALKGNDRAKFQVFQAAGAANGFHVVIANLQKEDYEMGDVVGGEFYADDTHKVKPYVCKAYTDDGSQLTRNGMDRLDKLLGGYFDFDSVEEYGDLLADQDTAKSMWGDGDTSLEVTGNEGATLETIYDAYVMLMFRPESLEPDKKRARA